MASMESNDAVFLRAVRLLNSTAEGSEDQLRIMLEDSIRQKYGNSTSLNLGQKKSSEEMSDAARDGNSSRINVDLTKSSHVKSSGSSPTSPHSITMAMLREAETSKEEAIIADDRDDDFALEILEEDLTCVICRGMDVGVRNQLVECLECHSLYHQECHQPPVPDDMNEPRSAWYCASCIKALNKIPSKSGSRSFPKPTSSSSRDREVSALTPKHSMKSDSAQSLAQTLFKRSDKGISNVGKGIAAPMKSQHTVTSSKPSTACSSKVFGGVPLSGKALCTSTPATSSKSSTSASGAAKSVVPKINIVSADKRLAIMKKKAAKLQEKRKLMK